MKKKILMIEDDMAIVDIYKTALEAKGFSVDVANYGEEAKEKFKKVEKGEEKKPDLILLDIVLPDVNGIDLLAEMRKKKILADIPVFALTNYSDEELKKQGSSLNVEEYIIKAEKLPGEVADMVKKRLE